MLDLTFFVMLLSMAYISAPALAHPSELNFGGCDPHSTQPYSPMFADSLSGKNYNSECIDPRLLEQPKSPFHLSKDNDQPTGINHGHIDPWLAKSDESEVAHPFSVDPPILAPVEVLQGKSKYVSTLLFYNPELNFLEQV